MNKFIAFLTFVFVSIFGISRMILSSRDVFGTSENPLSTYATIAIDSLSICVFLLYFIKLKIKKGIILTTIFWMIWIVATTIFMENDKFRHIVFMLFWPLTAILFYTLTIKSSSFFNKIYIYFPYLMIALLFIFFQSIVIFRHLFYLRASNLIFYPLLLLPWIVLVSNRFLKNILFIILFIAVILSFKRTALIVISFSTIIYIYYEYFKNAKLNTFYRYLIASAIICITVTSFISIDNQYNNLISGRFENLEEDKGSGRLDRYEEVIKHQGKSSTLEWIFGHGFRAVEISTDKQSGSAHNDFLEVLYDYGLIGFLIYLSLHFNLIRRLHLLKKTNSQYLIGYTISYIIFFVMSMFSHLIIYPTYFIFLTSYWGSIEGVIFLNKSNHRSHENKC